MNNFKTQIELDLLLDRNDNHTVETKTVSLSWDLELEMRQYGIKSTIISVPDQKFEVEICVWGDEDDTYETIVLDVKNVIIERESSSFDSLVPKSLSFFKNKWTLVF